MSHVVTEQLLTVQDAARLLRVHTKTVRRMIETGLEASRIGKRIYTSREAIERFSKPVTPRADQQTIAQKKSYEEARKRFGLRI